MEACIINQTIFSHERETIATDTRQLHYIAGGDGLAAIYVKYDTGDDSLYYVMQDHLGSLVGAVNSQSNHVYRQSFDAWGRKRNYEDWTYTNVQDEFPFLRGYTGHEHLKWFGLINMNGRMYDASLCRFLSPDPYVQMPDNSQSYNRYAYAMNNPLVFTDPTGEFPVAFAIGFVIGAYLGGMSSNDWKMNPREWEMNTNTFLAMGFGGLAGGFGGQYLLGPMGALNGGTLNFALGTQVGNAFQAGANFVVGNGGAILQGIGYTTAAGGGALFMMNNSQNFEQRVDQEIYGAQQKYWEGQASKLDITDFDDIQMHPAVGMGQKIVDVASTWEGSTEYNQIRSKGNFRPGNPKCNLFVYDVTTEAGASPGLPNSPGRSDIILGYYGARPPVASQWADPNYKIPGWVVATKPMPGDVASFNGHVGIVIGYDSTISATTTNGVVRNKWGFRNGHTPIFRRFVGF